MSDEVVDTNSVKNVKKPLFGFFSNYTRKLAGIAFLCLIASTAYNALRFKTPVPIKEFSESVVYVILAAGGKSAIDRLIDSRSKKENEL